MMDYGKIGAIACRCVTGYYELFRDIDNDMENIKNNKPTIEYAYVSLFRKVWERFEFKEDCTYKAMAISVLYGTIIADVLYDKHVVSDETSVWFLKEFSDFMGCNWKEFVCYIADEDEFFEACGSRYI